MTVPSDRRLQLSVLGPIQVLDDGRPIDLGTPRQRSILAALALSCGRTVSLDTLVSRVWGDEAPATSTSTLQRYVASLRKALEPGRVAHEQPTVIVTDGPGYVLRIPSDGDVAILENAVAEARTLLDGVNDMLRPRVPAGRATDAVRAADLLQRAMRLWRGQPYADLGDDPEASAERARLEDLRVAALELRMVATLGLGRHSEVVGELESMTALHPLHERWWALYAVALVRSGRQAEALEALAALRSLLADELGVDPSAPLRELHTAILRQDPSLVWTGDEPPPSTPDLHRSAHVPAPAAERAPARTPLVFRTPLAGRVTEVATLRDLLDRAGEGHGGAAYIAGEAGVGKTRLVQEVALLAHAEGFTVATAGCSEQSPPALWPLRVGLSSLARQLPTFTVDVASLDTHPDEFSTREHVVNALLEAADLGPVLLVVEDAQWADAGTLQVLEDVVMRCSAAPLIVVLTRRSSTGDERAMSRLAASVARAGGVRIDLEGLSLEEAGSLVRSVDGPVDCVRELWERSGGNPFFLTELALARGELSGSLADVVHARVMSLQPATVTVLQAASALDVTFDVRLLSLMLGYDQDETIELLKPAAAAGLVVEQDADTWSHAFSHAVVRDVVSAGQSQIAITTWHAAAGQALADHGDLRRVDQRASLAHHGERSGRSGAADAWRAILKAAGYARVDAAYAEEARLLTLAARLLERDTESGDRERFELLMLVIDACRWSGDWRNVSVAVDEAIVVAERLGDPAAAARAAVATAEGALWQVRHFGTVHAPIVEALERLLVRLGDDQAALRCRAQLALALELYYDPAQTDRIDALVAAAVEHAEQSDDLRLHYAACHGAFVATWRLDTVEQRRALAGRALELARRLDDPRAVVLAETLVLAAASELGQVDVVRADLDRVIDLADRRGLTTAEGVLRILATGWAAMRQDDDSVVAQAAALSRLEREARVPNFRTAVGATMVLAALLSGSARALERAANTFAPGDDVPTNLFGASLLVRFGELDAARAIMESGDVGLSTHTFLGPLNAALTCDVAASIGPTALLDDAYGYLLGHAGRMCSGGAAAPIGPVDLYLALGAKARADQDAAERHLHDAELLVHEWDLPGLQIEVDRVRRLVQKPLPVA